jgi:uncharacterized protein
MIKIGLISDTHSFMDERILDFFSNCEEIWHAGDIGSYDVIEQLRNITPKIRAVYGNIDSSDMRRNFDEKIIFDCENVKVMLTHISGYPGRYEAGIIPFICKHKIKLLIGGHSHILKVIFDKKYNLLHINPGAAGNYGIHQLKTAIRFEIDSENIKNMEIIELHRYKLKD